MFVNTYDLSVKGLLPTYRSAQDTVSIFLPDVVLAEIVGSESNCLSIQGAKYSFFEIYALYMSSYHNFDYRKSNLCFRFCHKHSSGFEQLRYCLRQTLPVDQDICPDNIANCILR